LPARDYVRDHHMHRNYFQIITFSYADTPYRAMARIELRTMATAHIMLYFTWRPIDQTTGLHGQAMRSFMPLSISAAEKSITVQTNKQANKQANKCVSRHARCKSHHTVLHNAAARNSDCPTEPRQPILTAHQTSPGTVACHQLR